MAEPVIVSAVRTPTGRRGGNLSSLHPAVLGGSALGAALSAAAVDPATVDSVLFGCVAQVGEQSYNLGRHAWLAEGLPLEVPVTTVDTQCASSQQALHLAAAMIRAGTHETVLAGGVESMSRVPMGSNTQGPGTPFPPQLMDRYPLVHQGVAAELVARKYGVGRTEMDELSVESHLRAADATTSGRFAAEIVPVTVTVAAEDGADDAARTVEVDEGIRYTASIESTAKLAPAFDPEHSITAGNSSQIADGAAAVLVMSESRAAELGVRARARIVADVVVGVDPVVMLEGPIPATRRCLDRAGVPLDDIDLFEVNEAFASVVLAWQKELGVEPERVNVNGGAIALGHPLGGSGARLMTTLLHELERRGGRYGLQTMCAGGGLGTATLVERL